MDDGDLKNAIDELERCTESIDKQTELLKQQQEALSRLVKTSKTGQGQAGVKEPHRPDDDRAQLAAKVCNPVGACAPAELTSSG